MNSSTPNNRATILFFIGMTFYCDASSALAYFQHAYFIPIVGVGKERRILTGPW